MLLNNLQIDKLKEPLMIDFIKRMYYSLKANFGIEKISSFENEKERIQQLTIRAINHYHIISENLVEDLIIISYQYSDTINFDENIFIQNLLTDKIKSEKLKIDELFTFCITN